MSTLRERVVAEMNAGRLRNEHPNLAAIRAAEAEVALCEERHAKENAELKAEYLRLIGDVAYHSNKWQTLERDHANERAEWEEQTAVADAFVEQTVQASVAAALAAEKERVTSAIQSDILKLPSVYWGAVYTMIYPPVKVTLKAGWYWVRVKDPRALSQWEAQNILVDFTPNPNWEYVKAEPPAEPLRGEGEGCGANHRAEGS